MASRRLLRRPLFVASVLIFGLSVISPALIAAPPTVWLMKFSIDSAEGYAVSGDGKGLYMDYRLTNDPTDFTDVNYCVEASPTNTLLFIRLNRPLVSGSEYCGDGPGTQRQFELTIASQLACDELVLGGYITESGPSCKITGLYKPRIRISSDLYAQKTTKTPVAFQTDTPDINAISYVVETESDATVGKPDASTRYVTYPPVSAPTAKAHLVRYEPYVKNRTIPGSFPLPFHMTFTRVAQP